jgi:hypothetical protein
VIRRCAAFFKCSHFIEYAALSKTPRALADGPILVFQHPASGFEQLQPGPWGPVLLSPWKCLSIIVGRLAGMIIPGVGANETHPALYRGMVGGVNPHFSRQQEGFQAFEYSGWTSVSKFKFFFESCSDSC